MALPLRVREMNFRDIMALTYADFVGVVNQWNVPPGAYSTLSRWVAFGAIDRASNILQVACTTGFQAREIALLTGCRGKAFDLSHHAAAMAQLNKSLYAPDINVDFFQCDGYQFASAERFSHVVLGAGLRFFPDPERMLGRCIDLLLDGGKVLASPFYTTREMPESLVSEAQAVFGIRPTTAGYKETMRLYRSLEILYEERCDIVPEAEDEIRDYCAATIDRAARMHELTDRDILDAMRRRLYSIRMMSNKLRPYQRFSILVLRYRSSTFPDRYVELF